jgi:excinuclease ABC subunit C
LLRSKEQTHSILDEIPNIGPTRRRELMKHFQNLEEIRQADLTRLLEVPSVNERAAKSIYEFFHEKRKEEKI